MNSAKFEKNLTKGSVVKTLIAFSLPFLLSNLIQTLYSVADMVIVGRFAGTASMSGVNIGSQITMIVTNMVLGLCVGATVLIAQYLGSGMREALKDTIGTLLTFLFGVAIAATIVMVALKEPILRLIKTPPESFSEADTYFFITMLGTVFIFGYNALSAIMRGMGDSKNPLIFVGIACVTNIVLDLVLVAVFDMAAAGAAIATVISQAVSMILCIIYLKKNGFVFDFSLGSMKIKRDRLLMLLRIGIPTSIQNVATGVSFLFLTALVNEYGVEASAAVGAAGKMNGFAILPAAALSASISAMSAQNIGAHEEKRAVKTMLSGLCIAMGISVVIFALISFFPEFFLRLFADDPNMVVSGVEYLRAFSFDYLFAPAMFCLNGLFIGAGHTTFSLINNAMSAVLIRIPVAYILGTVMKLGLFGVGLAAPAASVISLAVCIIFFFSGHWKKRTIIKN